MTLSKKQIWIVVVVIATIGAIIAILLKPKSTEYFEISQKNQKLIRTLGALGKTSKEISDELQSSGFDITEDQIDQILNESTSSALVDSPTITAAALVEIDPMTDVPVATLAPSISDLLDSPTITAAALAEIDPMAVVPVATLAPFVLETPTSAIASPSPTPFITPSGKIDVVALLTTPTPDITKPSSKTFDLIMATIAPTTAAPTTMAPTTAAPTTMAPTTAAPTTMAPTTAAPTTRAPTTAAPTTRAPTTAAPTTMAPTTAAPTTRAPTTAAPTTMAPTTAAPTTMAPTTAAPTTMAPTTAAPTTMAPTTAAPTTMAPTTAAPTTRAPTTAAPTTRAPTTAAPTTMAPTTAAPTIDLVKLAAAKKKEEDDKAAEKALAELEDCSKDSSKYQHEYIVNNLKNQGQKPDEGRIYRCTGNSYFDCVQKKCKLIPRFKNLDQLMAEQKAAADAGRKQRLDDIIRINMQQAITR